MKNKTTTKAFKAFDKDFKCRDFQYEVGKEYIHEGKIEICKEGFHSCEYPLDVLKYYDVNKDIRFGEIEATGNIEKTNDSDTKLCSSNIKINAEINIHTLIKAAIDFTFSKVKSNPELENKKDSGAASNSGYSGAASNSGYRGAASNSGDSGAASNSGDSGAASNSGYSGAASNSGDSGAASNSGYSGAASNSGYRGAASNSGYRGAASNSGDSGAASNSGNSGAASNSGDSGAASNSGNSGAAFTNGVYSSAATDAKESVAVGVGYSNRCKASLNSWIVLAERNSYMEILSIESFKVDGEKIKANTWYSLINSSLKEV